MSTMPDANTDAAEMYQTNYMAIASFCVLIWDHIITFDQEVEYIWSAKKNLLVYLFFFNRYVTPLGFIVNLFGYLSPVWTPESCNRLVHYEAAMTVIGIHVVALMMFIRMKALYYGQRFVHGLLASVGLLSFLLNTGLLTRGVSAVHNPASGVHSCVMVFDNGVINQLVASLSMRLPFAYDTIVLALTLYKTFSSLRHKTTSYVMQRLAADGILYYFVIHSTALIWIVMMTAAPTGIQNLVAPLDLLLTVTMMSRITISLKSSVEEMKSVDVIRPILPSLFTQRSHLDVISNIQIATPGFNQSVDSQEIGLRMSALDPTRHQVNHFLAVSKLESIEGVDEGPHV